MTAQRNGVSKGRSRLPVTARGHRSHYTQGFSACQRRVIKDGLRAGVPEPF